MIGSVLFRTILSSRNYKFNKIERWFEKAEAN